MRISSLQIYQSGVQNMLDVNSQVALTQQQLSTGKKIQSPADDPVGSTRALQLQMEIDTRAQYQKNGDVVSARLSQEDTQLDSIQNAMQRVRELTLQAANTATLTQQDRADIAKELQQRSSELLGLMNSRDANGEYIFAGFKGNTVPFVQQGSPASALYQGDDGQRLVQVGPSNFVAQNDSGADVFMNVPASAHGFYTSASPINKSSPPATISAGFVYDQTAYDAFYPNDMVLEFQNSNSVVPPGSNFNVIQKSDGRVLQSNVRFTSGQPIQINGAQFTITGTPQEGDTFAVTSKDTKDILTTINQLADGLTNLPNGTALQTLIDNSLSNIDNANENISRVRADIGGRLNTLDDVKALHQQMDIEAKKLLSSIQDTDYTEAISRLSFQTTVLQAAQQSFAKVSQLSLFDKL